MEEQVKQGSKTDLTNLRFYTLSEVQKIIGVTYRTVLAYAEAKKLKAVKVGGRWLVRENDLESFLSGN